MFFLINKVQKECTAVVKAVRITRSQYIREAVKKGYFLGIIPKPMDPPPSVHWGQKNFLTASLKPIAQRTAEIR